MTIHHMKKLKVYIPYLNISGNIICFLPKGSWKGLTETAKNMTIGGQKEHFYFMGTIKTLN